MLQCLVVAVRPLRVEELAELLAFEFDAAQGEIPKYRPALRLDDQTQAVLSTCSSLVTIIIERDGRRVVQFSHFSVKEFLVSNRLASSFGDISRYHIRLGSAHTVLTQTCLGFLLHLDDHTTEESVAGFPLADYAARHWVEHAQYEGIASRVNDGMESLFDSDKPHFAAWVRIYNMDTGFYGRHSSVIPNPLYYSVLCGFYDLAEHLTVKHPHYINSVGGEYEFPLLAALAKGHVSVAELLLKHGANVAVREATGMTPLLVALSSPHDKLNTVEFLLKHGADVNARDDQLTSSIHMAEMCGEQDIVQILLKHKPDVNAQDKDGKTPLHLLLENYSEHSNSEDDFCDHTRLLLEHGAEVNRRDKYNQSPLHLAIRRNLFRVAGILLEHGADANAENNHGMTPLHLLPLTKSKDDGDVLNIVELLLKHGAEVNRRDKYNQSPLYPAIRWNSFRLAGILLEHGADANAENNDRMTPLHLLSETEVMDEGNVLNLAVLLLKHGAEVNRRDKNNGSPLHLAIRWSLFRLAGILLKHGADANAENNNGRTPLHSLTGTESEEEGDVLNILELLLKHGTEVNRQDKYNESPLHLAIRRKSFRLAGILLEHGADANAENNHGMTPLHVLSETESEEDGDVLNLAVLLLKHGVEVNRRDKDNESPLHLAIRWNLFRVAGILLEHGADANAENNDGMTLLHILCSQTVIEDEGVAQLLLEHGTDVNAQGKNNTTPLHLASYYGKVEIARVLLDRGANVSAKNAKGQTPLHMVPRGESSAKKHGVSVAQLLLEHGAGVNAQDSNHATPLDLALRHGRPEVVSLLLHYGGSTEARIN